MEQLLECLYVNRELHAVMFEDVCKKYNVSVIEILILVLLHNQKVDTAKQIVKTLKIAKSHISSSIRDLELKGYITCHVEDHDRRTVHLQVNECANDLLHDSHLAHMEYAEVLLKGFSVDEVSCLRKLIEKLIFNANGYLDRK